jgi:hypothetical protein
LAASRRLFWSEHVAVESGRGGEMRIEGPGCRLVLRPPTPAVARALSGLAPPGQDEDRLVDSLLSAEGAEALARWYYLMQRPARRGFLRRAIDADGGRLATLLPASPAFPIALPSVSGRPHRLSRFAYLHREEDRLVAESPRGPARVVFDDHRAAALVCALAKGATTEELATCGGTLDAEAIAKLMSFLVLAGSLNERRRGRVRTKLIGGN